MNSNSCNKTSCSEISLTIPSKAALSSSSIAISANSIESEIDSSSLKNLSNSFSRLTFCLLSSWAVFGSSQAEGSLSLDINSSKSEDFLSTSKIPPKISYSFFMIF